MREAGTQVIRLPPRSPNLNAYAERFVRSIKNECLNRMIFVGQASLRRAILEYMAHYHEERNHQGLDNRLIRQKPGTIAHTGCVTRRPRGQDSAHVIAPCVTGRADRGCDVALDRFKKVLPADNGCWRRLDDYQCHAALTRRLTTSMM